MTNSIQNAIVIGGNGLVGQQLVKQLNQLPECKNITVVLRRPCSELNRLEKVQTLLLEDFLLLNDEDVSGYSHAFSCLGTTLKKVGSKEAFYAVDYTINAHFAELLQAKGTHYLLISALGADANSKLFYNRVKGELEQYIESLDICNVSAKYSLLATHSPFFLHKLLITAKTSMSVLVNFSSSNNMSHL